MTASIYYTFLKANHAHAFLHHLYQTADYLEILLMTYHGPSLTTGNCKSGTWEERSVWEEEAQACLVPFPGRC